MINRQLYFNIMKLEDFFFFFSYHPVTVFDQSFLVAKILNSIWRYMNIEYGDAVHDWRKLFTSCNWLPIDFLVSLR